MNITAIALRNDRTAIVVLVLIVLAGLAAFTAMPRAYDPGFTIRAAQIVTRLPGASPERMELLVSDPIEQVVQEIPELDFVTSESRTGISIVAVNIRESYTEMRPIWDSLRRKIDDVADELPEGIIGPDVNDEFGDVFGIVLTITGEGFSFAELQDIAEDVRSELLLIPDAAKVDIFGTQEERIFVEYDNARLAELEISPAQLGEMLSAQNIISPGGSITVGPERMTLEPTGNFDSVADIADSVIRIPGSDKLVLLKDIATVSRAYTDPPQTLVRSTGTPALALAISMRAGGNNIRLGDAVLARLNQLRGAYPIGIDFNLINFSPAEVQKKVRDFVVNLLQAIAVVTAVMLLSLGLRTGLVVAGLIPLSMLAAIFVMSWLNIGLDQISLAALIIALGMLVDNGIVMSESIMTQMSAGKSAFEAAIDSSEELKVPLLTASLTTAAAFLPIYLAESATGEFTASLFKVVTITLLCSWLLAMTAIPLLCTKFLRVEGGADTFDTLFYRRYRALLTTLLARPVITLAIVAIAFGASLYAARYLPSIFFPPSDRAYFTAELALPPGTDITRTAAVVGEIEAFMAGELMAGPERPDGITSWISYIGSGGARFVLTHSPEPNESSYALMVINVSSAAAIDGVMASIDTWTFNRFPDLRVGLKKIENGSPVDKPVEIRLSGIELGRLFENVESLKAEMLGVPGLKNISDDWGTRIRKLTVNIDQARALRAGVTSEDIAVSLQAGLSGLSLTEYREESDLIPVMLRADTVDRQDIGKLEALSVYSQSAGTSVPLLQVADTELSWEPAKILRRDRLKTVTIGAQLEPGYTAAEGFAALAPWLETTRSGWDPGYRYELGGEAESSTKANRSIAEKLPIAAMIIVLLLIGQFNSVRKAAIVLVTIPLALIGVIAGLYLARSYFGFMTLLGVISLAGIVINNAIVLLERIQLEITVNGRPPFEAIIEAAQRRTRPILLTTATTVLGLVPLYLGGGAMWEPMAIAIIAGLLFSTLLTLAVVPVMYAALYRVRR